MYVSNVPAGTSILHVVGIPENDELAVTVGGVVGTNLSVFNERQWDNADGLIDVTVDGIVNSVIPPLFENIDCGNSVTPSSIVALRIL